jgi:DNA-binding response OmpR family regulator
VSLPQTQHDGNTLPAGHPSPGSYAKIERVYATAAASRGNSEPVSTGIGARLRVLFVGRAQTADALLTCLQTLSGGSSSPLGQDGADTAELVVLVTVTNQKAALHEVRMQPPRVVLVEMEVSQGNRIHFCEMLRHRLPTALIYAIAADALDASFVFDGVLAAPFVADELATALHSARETAAEQTLQRGPIRLNTATRTVITPNGRHHMTPKQCALLHMLMLNANQVVSRTRLMADIWETSYLEDTRTLDVHVRWLRERIEPDPSAPVYLLTERGKGYMLRVG